LKWFYNNLTKSWFLLDSSKRVLVPEVKEMF